MRDPIMRTLSAFYAWTGRQGRGNQVSGIEVQYGRVRLARHFNCRSNTAAASLLANVSATIEDFAALSPEERSVCRLGTANLHVKYLAPDTQNDTRQQYELALKRLREFAWVGVLERGQDMFKLLSYTFGLELELYTPVSNANTYSKNISEPVRKVLEEMNQYDLMLYDRAREMFDERWKEFVEQDPGSPDHIDFECQSKSATRCWDKTSNGSATVTKDIVEAMTKSNPNYYKSSFICGTPNGCRRKLPMN